MCGRFTFRNPGGVATQSAFRLDAVPQALQEPRYNVAPGQLVLVLRERQGRRRVAEAHRWGIHAPWKPGGGVLINARLGSLDSSVFWGPLLAAGRCAIPADGFYEWRAQGAGRPKQPLLFEFVDGEPFAFAGIIGSWHDRDGGEQTGCVIVTTEANELVADAHDRMPVMLRDGAIDAWLGADERAAIDAIEPVPSVAMTARPVSRAVNDVSRDDPSLLDGPGPEPVQSELF